MPKFIPYNFNQDKMVVINYANQLQAGTFEYALHYLIIEKLDISVFYPAYNNDSEKGGRPAYDPAILLKIVLFAYYKGIISSREIEWQCRHNVIFKALSCDSEPHFSTIAAFVSSHSQAMEAIFEQVLLICDQQGLLGKELFAIDGCKISSNAAKEWSGTFDELDRKSKKIRRQIKQRIEQHRQFDQYETRDDERQRRHEQTIDTLSKAADKIEHFLNTRTPRIGQGRKAKEVKSNITDNESAKMTTSKGTIQGYNGVAAVDKKHQIIVDAQAFGHGQEHYVLQPVTEKIKERFARLGIDKDIYKAGAIVTADTGFANEANMQYLHENNIDGYIPDNQFRSRDPRFTDYKQKHNGLRLVSAATPGLIAASAFMFDPIKQSCVCPAGEKISHRDTRANERGELTMYFEGKLLQCRSCDLKTRCMKNPAAADHRKGRGRQVSFLASGQRAANYTDWMKHRIDSDKGRQIYGHRMSVVEPVFANITAQKKLKQFGLRGKRKVDTQWKLYCVVHNMEKIQRYGAAA